MAELSSTQEQLAKETLEKRAERLISHAIGIHGDFDKKIWARNGKAKIEILQGTVTPSFHHEEHIKSTLATLDEVFAHLAKENDPFGLFESLNRWNEGKPEDAKVTIEDFQLACRIGFAGHDLGNLTEGYTIKGKDSYAKQYLRVDAEKRSVDITDELINEFLGHSSDNKDIKRLLRIKPLVSHLTMLTIYDPATITSPKPFFTFVQVIDQIGPYYFSELSNEEWVAGLLNEWRVRNEKPPNLKEWMEFSTTRLDKLVPDQEQREAILAIFDPIGKKRAALADSPARAAKMLGDLDRPVAYKTDIPNLWGIGK